MANVDFVQSTFTRGELSPRLQGRIDFQGFFDGVEKMENYFVLPQGGVQKRSGTRFVAQTESDVPTRLLPFEFSETQTYVLEFGDQTLRFFADEGQLVANTVSATITNGTFDSNINGWDDNSNGTGAISHASNNGGRLRLNPGNSSGNEAIAHQDISITETDTIHSLRFSFYNERAPRNGAVRVRVATTEGGNDLIDNLFDFGHHIIDVDPDGNSTIHVHFEVDENVAGRVDVDDVEILSNEPLEIFTPYTDADTFLLKWTQSADIMWLCHPSFEPYQLRRFGAAEFSLVKFKFEDGPYLAVNETSTTLSPGSTSGRTTITASATDGINDGEGFKDPEDENRWVRIKHSGTWGAAEIIQVSSSTEVDVIVQEDFGGTGAVTDWRLGAWTEQRGWPHCATFHNQRLSFGATDADPQRLWMSVTGDFPNFQPSASDGTVSDDDSINVAIASSQVNFIRWIESMNVGLAIGTSGAEFLLRPASTAAALSPTNIEVERQTNRGSADTVLPEKIGHTIMFPQRGNRTIRNLGFDFDIDGLVAADLSLVSEHLLRQRVGRLAYQQNTDSVLWVLTNDARVQGFTFESDQEVFAWHTQRFGGTFDGADPAVESITTVSEDTRDQLWLVVRRDINGSPVRYIEFLEEPWLSDEQPIEDAFFVDSGLSGDFPGGTTSVGGLGHLEGETVQVLADGATHPDRTVSGGSISLEREANTVQVGLGYSARIRSFPFNTGVEGQITTGKVKRISTLHVLFFETVGAKYGWDEDNLDTVFFRDSSDEMDAPVDPFTGVKTVNFPMRHDLEAYYIVESDQPLPSTILSVGVEMEVYSARK